VDDTNEARSSGDDRASCGEHFDFWRVAPLLADSHRSFLHDSGITDETIQRIGITTADARDDLPKGDWSRTLARVPGILFPWPQVGGGVRYQLRPDDPADAGDRPAKYVWPKGETPALGVFSEPDGAQRVLIVEGTKQALAAASYAGPEVAVYGIAGCRTWQSDGVPTPDLAVVDGRDIVVILDADAASNLDVYEAGTRLAAACRAEGAKSVTFARLPAGKKAGLDDVLGARAPERRAGFLERLVSEAKTKPADAKPKPKARAKALTPAQARAMAGHDDPEEQASLRGRIVVNDDPLIVINDITAALKNRWDGRSLFNHGGVLSRLQDGALQVLPRGKFLDLIQATARTVRVHLDPTTEEELEDFAWPDQNVISAASSRAEQFTTLDAVARAPFVRADGTVATAAGYDEASRTFLILDADMARVVVPNEPTREEIDQAVKLLLVDWLGDFPFPTDADRAGVLALILTALMRPAFDVVPVAVVNGLQMGVGKNLLADVIAILLTGRSANPLPYTTVDEEHRKVITSTFRSGASLFVFDECHVLEGASFARAITAPTYSDRVLGGNDLAEFPNRVTWMTLGNNVRVNGDMARRVYEIALRTNEPNPQDRSSDSFRHADLKDWTERNRPELLGAALTLAKAWHAAGRPVAPATFGSFERWERTIRGVLGVAGVRGFLDNLAQFRSESVFDRQYWEEHLAWLAGTFGESPFTAGEARARLGKHRADASFPPGMEDPTTADYSRKLGQAYHGQRDKWYGPYRLTKVGQTRGNTAKWCVTVTGPKTLVLKGLKGPLKPPVHEKTLLSP
jgi:hypothetical protein